MIYVVGSGPSGVSGARALLKKGYKVTLLDAGRELEPDRQAVLSRLKSGRPETWSADDLGRIKENMLPTAKGLPLKYVYGSDFPYHLQDDHFPIQYNNADIFPSLARGGLSNVWGACILPYTQADMEAWPIKAADLEEHYRAVLSFTDMSAADDDLAGIYPLHTDDIQDLGKSRQARNLLRKMDENKAALNKQGMTCGHARLFLRSRAKDNDAGCVYCGLCMYGCPYELIYNSAATLAELRESPDFSYVNGVIVQKVEESADKVTILATDKKDNRLVKFTGDRVYLAGGVIPTTKIVLASLESYDRNVIMKDSQYYLMPYVSYRGAGNVAEEDLYTFSQVFMNVKDPKIGSHSSLIEIYTHQELFLKTVENVFGPLKGIMKLPIKMITSRLMLLGGFLHSDYSPQVMIRLARTDADEFGKLILEGRESVQAKKIVRRIVGKLLRNNLRLGALPVLPMLQVTKPGRSFHTGGTFPMRSSPREFQTDTLGRPFGFKRMHLIDSSVFPTLPGLPITFAAMANAHRIASACGEV
jgi:choline dehydrogenase-like flavoprotein